MANPPNIRNYKDLRNKFIRGLIKHEHQQRRHQFLKQAAEWTSKAIVSLSLASEPIRSAKQATMLEGVGATIRARLDKIQQESGTSNEDPLPGQHVSTGSGLLVAMLNESEAIRSSEGGKPLVEESELKEAFLCPAWWRVNVLISRGYLKKRTRGKKAVYELLEEGEDVARRLRGNHPPPFRVRNTTPSSSNSTTTTSSAQSNKKAPSCKKKAKTSNSSSTPSLSTKSDGPLYSHDSGSDGVIMLVDDHELGGDRIRLGELSRRLKEWNVQHKTAHLPCGDYWWLWRHKGQEVTLPVLVERKRADDLAESIKDGRFCSQKDKMKQWRKDFGMLSNEVCLHYIVESTPEAYCVRCMDGCGGVGKCGNPTVEQLEVVIMELERSRDFNLIRTENLETTVEFLASVSAELERRVKNGDFEALRLMKQDRHVTSAHTSSNETHLVSRATHSTPNSHLNSLPSTSRTSPGQSLANHSFAKRESKNSPVRSGTKRQLPYVDIDFSDDRKPPKIKPEVVDLCDSQDDDIFLAPFDDLPNVSTATKDKHKPDKKPISTHTSNQNAQKGVNQDEEAKIVAIRDVMPDAKLGDILSALSSCGGNVDLAVAKLLDNN
ncbi:Crossover junction endonuclease MUS81 [Exaiptasia diaphana]|nr:Crossover junction endonuclease MUS81 [Exaiptasia diaphana]